MTRQNSEHCKNALCEAQEMLEYIQKPKIFKMLQYISTKGIVKDIPLMAAHLQVDRFQCYKMLARTASYGLTHKEKTLNSKNHEVRLDQEKILKLKSVILGIGESGG